MWVATRKRRRSEGFVFIVGDPIWGWDFVEKGVDGVEGVIDLMGEEGDDEENGDNGEVGILGVLGDL